MKKFPNFSFCDKIKNFKLYFPVLYYGFFLLQKLLRYVNVFPIYVIILFSVSVFFHNKEIKILGFLPNSW